MKRKILGFICLAVLLISGKNDEGQFPLSNLRKIDLKKAGLEIPQSEIFNNSGKSLINALVRIDGCTGSFISDKGLIITNHHCVYSQVAAVSTSANNYLDNGFYAKNTVQEIKTKMTCKITQSYSDVSMEVLKGTENEKDPINKAKTIAKNIEELTKTEQEKHQDLKIEISEMLVGKSYTLFRYKTLNDVRLVYVPPQEIGKFGGDTDNWEWPRHNADFSIVRAYENGQPYIPPRHLQVASEGTNEGDFAFILGYPGRTFRNQPAQFLTYQQQHLLPIISDWFYYRINAIEEYIGNDVDKKLKYAGSLARLHNTAKNFKGKLQGLARTSVIQDAYEKQERLKEFAKNNKEYNAYSAYIDDIEKLYAKKLKIAREHIYLGQLSSSSNFYIAAAGIASLQDQLKTVSKKDRKKILEEKAEEVNKVFGGYKNLAPTAELDEKLFAEVIYQISNTKLPELKSILEKYGLYNKTKAEISSRINNMLVKSKLNLVDKQVKLYDKNLSKFLKNKSELVGFARALSQFRIELYQQFQEVELGIDNLIPRLIELKMAMDETDFIPDANSTVRLTYGYIKGYQPMDAVHHFPFTTITGILEKANQTSVPDYVLRPEVLEKLKTTVASDKLRHPANNQVVVGMLYNMDTTGGNSGSPVLNARGELIGVNFDRTYTATINDFAWNEKYSRSVGVDIRFVLYIMKYFGEADEILEEMGVVL
jgi:hypothetical protein